MPVILEELPLSSPVALYITVQGCVVLGSTVGGCLESVIM